MSRSDRTAALPVHLGGVAAALGVTGLGAWLTVLPMLQAGSHQAEIESTRQRLTADVADRRDRLAGAREQRDRLLAELGTAGISLDPSDRLADRLGVLSRLAEERGITILELSPGEQRPHAICVIHDIRMVVTAPASTTTLLLGDIAVDRHGLAVRSVRVAEPAGSRAGDPDTPGDHVRTEIQLDWYALRTDQPDAG